MLLAAGSVLASSLACTRPTTGQRSAVSGGGIGRGVAVAALPPLRIVSYNIRHGRGMDDQVNLTRTTEVLRRLEADLIGLQEVDDRVRRSGGVPQADSLGASLGMHAAFGAFMPYQGGHYGLGIL